MKTIMWKNTWQSLFEREPKKEEMEKAKNIIGSYKLREIYFFLSIFFWCLVNVDHP